MFSAECGFNAQARASPSLKYHRRLACVLLHYRRHSVPHRRGVPQKTSKISKITKRWFREERSVTCDSFRKHSLRSSRSSVRILLFHLTTGGLMLTLRTGETPTDAEIANHPHRADQHQRHRARLGNSCDGIERFSSVREFAKRCQRWVAGDLVEFRS
jgi:hypothetical protein